MSSNPPGGPSFASAFLQPSVAGSSPTLTLDEIKRTQLENSRLQNELLQLKDQMSALTAQYHSLSQDYSRRMDELQKNAKSQIDALNEIIKNQNTEKGKQDIALRAADMHQQRMQKQIDRTEQIEADLRAARKEIDTLEIQRDTLILETDRLRPIETALEARDAEFRRMESLYVDLQLENRNASAELEALRKFANDVGFASRGC
jgi:chromosome segregation ATPase